jgi:hypothetical protein
MGKRPSALCGVYRVERFVQDGHVLPEDRADAARWREVAFDRFGDYMRIRRMDDAEMLMSASGYSFRFAAAVNTSARAGPNMYQYGDYQKVLAKTAGFQGHLRFRELPNDRSPHPGVNRKPGRSQFFNLDYDRDDSGHLSLRGRIDGAETSADLLRVSDDSFAFVKSREGRP